MYILIYIIVGFLFFLFETFLNKKKYSNKKVYFLSLLFYLISAGLLFKLFNDKFIKYYFLVVVFKFIFELFYKSYFLEDYFFKDFSILKKFIIELIIGIFINFEIFNKVDDIFLSGESLLFIIWFIIILIIYHYLSNNNKEELKKSRKEYKLDKDKIVYKYTKLKILFNDNINFRSKYDNLLVYSILIFNDFNRPKFLRNIDNIKYRFNGRENLFGIGQIKSKFIISDEESISLLKKEIKSIKSNNKKKNTSDILKVYNKENYKYINDIYNELVKFCN